MCVNYILPNLVCMQVSDFCSGPVVQSILYSLTRSLRGHLVKCFTAS